MASRQELIEICKELGIEYDGLKVEEMKNAIRQYADKRFDNKPYRISIKDMSKELLKFLTKEHDFKIIDKNENEIDYLEACK